MNFMDSIKGAVAQQAMDKLGAALGMDSKQASSAFETASAVILGNVMKKAGSGSAGAKSIFDMANKVDPSMLDKLGDAFSGSGAAAEGFQKAGGGLLDSILGADQSGMISAIAKALGLDKDMIGKLLKMVAPIVVGMLGKQIKSQGLDVGGLTNFLSSQQSTLKNFLPGSLSSDLGLSSLTAGASRAVSGAANKAAGATKAAASEAADAGGGLLKTVLPIVAIAALAFLAWRFFLSKGEEVVDAATSAVQDASSAVTEGAAQLADKMPSWDSLDFSALGETGLTLKEGLGDISKGLTGLAAANADEAGANDLLSKISSFSGNLDGLGLGSFEGTAKTALSTIIGTFLQTIRGQLDKIPEPLKTMVVPAVNSLVEKLTAFK